MSSLMGQREYIVENARFIVHHDVRITVVGAITERTTLLALIGVAIAPSTTQPLSQNVAVFAAQEPQRSHGVGLLQGSFNGSPRFETARAAAAGLPGLGALP